MGYLADLFEPGPGAGHRRRRGRRRGPGDWTPRTWPSTAPSTSCALPACELIPVSLPERDPYPLGIMLSAEAAAAFQELTLSGRDDQLVRQIRAAWPNVFRAAQFIPAVEYLQANRQRLLLMQDFDRIFAEVDVYVTPSFGGAGLLMTNLTGHPQLVAPSGFLPDGSPHSISVVGDLYGEAAVVTVGEAYQALTDWHRRRPPGFLMVERAFDGRTGF